MRLYDFESVSNTGQCVRMSEFAGRVVLIVNTASACRFTPQYVQLQALHERYADRGLVVLAYPCNQFLWQEPSNDEGIATFCARFKVDFPIMAKVSVQGVHADPLWVWLRQQATGVLSTNFIKWNFSKFLIAPDGRSVERFAPATPPVNLTQRIEALLELCDNCAHL